MARGVGSAGSRAGRRAFGGAPLGWGLAGWAVLGVAAGLRLAGRLRCLGAALSSVLGFALIAASYATLVLLKHGPARFL